MYFVSQFLRSAFVTLTASACLWGCSSDIPPEPELSVKQQMNLRTQIMKGYQQWRGVPYRYGGESRRGMDCSAFVQTIFRNNLGMRLPRSTSQQKNLGKPVEKKELQIGDLIFFNRNTHVGIYVGNGRFVHASTRKGITIAELNNVYFKNRYTQSRRIIFPKKS
ncbi:hypothetical protein A6A19_01705 [Actinobacillus delphinicola]|uniref:NLP/P60 protein n=1 Tax=Actinobacillus delphinicola TaxID=51161 RepID=A0A448TW70_9PAST|nr:NlpC/P60 family protein [Actinobacillus delphinicola]MDG6896742.1 hypothetical protein [Actinobacillus delphinicola]VEJ10174.1 NLP/P60 protein [Actinobacillus delphinicola]